MKTTKLRRKHTNVRGILFHKNGEIKIIKQLRTMKRAIKEGYEINCLTNERIMKAKSKNELFPKL